MINNISTISLNLYLYRYLRKNLKINIQLMNIHYALNFTDADGADDDGAVDVAKHAGKVSITPTMMISCPFGFQRCSPPAI